MFTKLEQSSKGIRKKSESCSKLDGSGIIRSEEYKDNNTIYKPVTDSSIENTPLMKVFTAENFNNEQTQKQADVLQVRNK